MSDPEVNALSVTIARLNLRPGDKLVVQVPTDWFSLGDEATRPFVDYIQEWAGPAIPILLVSDDVKLSVLSTDSQGQDDELSIYDGSAMR